MYIKFCRSYGEDKKDETKENLSSKLSVELEGEKGKQDEGKASLYRVGCLVLTIICLVLFLVIIVLSVKLQTASTVCPEREETTAVVAPTCNYKQCEASFPNIQPQNHGCQQCPDGWLTFGQMCFFLSTTRLSWDQSQTNCSSRGASLAVITSQSVQNFLSEKGKMKYWIGLRHKGNSWTWIDNTVLQESYWAADVPPGDCGILSSEKPRDNNWIKAPCDFSAYYICHAPL